jgi:hypothetical protein
MSHAAPSVEASTGDAPTPFYDHLMSMIHATALENRRVARNDEVDAASGVGLYRWRIHLLVPCIAGLVVVAAVGRVLLVSDVSQSQPPLVTADADYARQERSHVADNATTADGLAERPARAAEPDGSGPIGADEMQTAEASIGPAAVAVASNEQPSATSVAAESDERPSATPAAGQPVENPGSGVETGGDGQAVAQAPAEAMQADPLAPATVAASEQPLPPSAPSSWPSTIETASVEQPVEPAATRIALVVSDVSMRAGPSKGKAVLATIARGRHVEVIGCRQWCEVIYAGQRGWVYKSFIGASPIPGGR